MSGRAGALRYPSRSHVTLMDATARDLGIKPFGRVRCQRCRAGLHDSAGNPRWEILDGQFVCPERCRAVA